METTLPDENAYVFDPESAAEMARLINQDRFVTNSMGGPLARLPELPLKAQIADLACGAGGWAIEVAFAHPDYEVCGVDISHTMINYANARTSSQLLTNVSFGVMDITKTLDFDDHSFDLVNARFLVGSLKREVWPAFIAECTRILRPGGMLRLTEVNETGISLSPSLEKLTSLMLQAMWRAGYGFSVDGKCWSMSPAIPRLLRQAGYHDLHMLSYVTDYSAHSELWADYYHNNEIVFFQIKPLVLSLGLIGPQEFEDLYQQALIEMQQGDFTCVAQAVSTWGRPPQ